MATPALEMIVTHLNAPYGAVVTVADVVKVLRHGSAALVGNPVADVLGWLFVECRPPLIERACVEAGLPTHRAATVYASLVAAGAPRVPAWELGRAA